MRIILAAPRGFCAGVNMAIESLRLAIERFGSPVYVFHEIVHNRWVVERFRRMGAIFVDDIGVPPQGATLLYSAHGVAPAVRRQAELRGLRVVDATCPLVMKVHFEAVRLARQGYTIILIGHAGHDEVVGTMGEAPDAMRLVQRLEEIDGLDVKQADKVAYLTQTTLSVDDAARIVARLKERFPGIVGPKNQDICYATQSRQEAIKRLAQTADVVLVVGSANSSNSQRLAELARATGTDSRLIDGPDDIDLHWFAGDENVAITAGASAPEDVVQQCVRLLQSHFAAEIEELDAVAENVRFQLPRELRAR